MKLSIIANTHSAEHLSKKSTPVLSGDAAFVKIYEKGESHKEYPEYLKQNSIGLLGSKKVMVAYVHKHVSNALKKHAPIIGSYVLHKYFESKARSTKGSSSLYVYVHQIEKEMNGQPEINVEVWRFKKGCLESLVIRMKLDNRSFAIQLAKAITEARTKEFSNAHVYLYSNGNIPNQVTDQEYITIFGNQPFELSSNKVEAIIEKRFGRFRGYKIMDSNSLNGGSWKNLAVPCLLSIGMVAAIPVYDIYKSEEFGALQDKYRKFEHASEGLPDQALLTRWENKRLYWNSLANMPNPVKVQSDVVAALTRVAKSKPKLGMALERLDVRLGDPVKIQDSTFNVEIEVGVMPQRYISPEEQASQFAALLTQSLGKNIVGNVDIWDDVVTRTIKGQRYHIVKLYLNHAEMNKGQTQS